MSIVESTVEAALTLLSSMGLAGLYVLAVLELLLAPIPGEVVMALAGLLASRGDVALWQVVTVGTLGNLTGSFIQYLLGWKIARPVLIKLLKRFFIDERDLEKAERFFSQRSGFAAVAGGRLVPGVRSVISLPAGMARMSLPAFTAATLIGSLPWNTIFAYLGFVLGENWHVVRTYSTYLDIAGAAVLAALTVYIALKLAERSRRARANRTQSTPPAPSGTREVGT
ncbi:MAG: DedA family protein [Thermofilaceae archaeon]